MSKKRVIYYDSFDFDPIGSEVAPRKIGADYKYIRGGASEFFSELLYRGVATPLAFLYSKLCLCEKYVYGTKLPRGGYFLFSNHTEQIGDAFSPSISQFPRRVYVVVDPKNLAWGPVARLTPALGALPLPGDRHATRAFSEAIRKRLSEGGVIAVYPEAHLWPKYTGLRPFSPTAFDMAGMFSAPIYTATRVYQKGRLGVRSVIYIDGPFNYDNTLPRPAAREALIRSVRGTMEERLKLTTAEPIIYEKRTQGAPEEE